MELNISDAEMVVMRVVWSLGAAKVDDVMVQVADRQHWSLATVKTLLGRLVKKGILDTEKEGRCFVYQSRIAECDALDMMAEELLGKVCATNQRRLLTTMLTSSNLTTADVEALTDLLAQKVPVASVFCTCLNDFRHCDCVHEHEAAVVADVQ